MIYKEVFALNVEQDTQKRGSLIKEQIIDLDYSQEYDEGMQKQMLALSMEKT